MPLTPHHRRIWQRAVPFLQVRQNDVHTRYCYAFAERLAALHPDADTEVVLPAILLHDVGWSTVPEDRIPLSLGPRARFPELRRQHEIEGARIAADILTACGHPDAQRHAIVSIIDGHDTHSQARSLDDALVKDADKLWRYTPFGLETVARWLGHPVSVQLDLLDEWIRTRFHTDAARHMALGLLAALTAAREITP